MSTDISNVELKGQLYYLRVTSLPICTPVKIPWGVSWRITCQVYHVLVLGSPRIELISSKGSFYICIMECNAGAFMKNRISLDARVLTSMPWGLSQCFYDKLSRRTLIQWKSLNPFLGFHFVQPSIRFTRGPLYNKGVYRYNLRMGR